MEPMMSATDALQSEKPHKDNIFGICNAIGEDFGFNPFFLRLAFAAALLASPEITLATYAGLGVIVLASRLATQRSRKAKTVASQDGAQPWSPTIPAIRLPDRVEGDVLEPAI
jgi:phage shock protein C